MQNDELATCLARINRQAFCRLDTDHGLLSTHRTDAAQVYPVPATGTLLPPGPGANFAGNTSGHSSKQGLEKLITVSATVPPTLARVAVAAVIDEASNQAPLNAGDWPVVLVVGINYGQQGSHNYVASPPDLYDRTNMRAKLQATAAMLAPHGCVNLAADGYHLVAANFFPWITNAPWMACTPNNITEQLLIRYFGWPSPLGFVALLIQQLQVACRTCQHGLTHIVFHGANNAVPSLGGGLVSRTSLTCSTPPSVPLYKNRHPLRDPNQATNGVAGPDVIFCDNLAPGAGGSGVQNATLLWQEPPPRQAAHDVMDEDE